MKNVSLIAQPEGVNRHKGCQTDVWRRKNPKYMSETSVLVKDQAGYSSKTRVLVKRLNTGRLHHNTYSMTQQKRTTR